MAPFVLRRAALAVVTAACTLLACSPDATRGAGARAPASERARARRPPAAADWYWEAIDAEVHEGEPRPIDLPVPATAVSRLEGAVRLWDDLGDAGRDRVRRDGLLVLPPLADAPGPRLRMGAFYTELRERRLPALVTVDALYAVSLLGIGRAVAAVETSELAPAVEDLVTKLAARLETPGLAAAPDLREPVRVARAYAAVAATLATGAAPPADLAALVAAEVAKIEAHAGVDRSPVLGVPIDYARFSVPPSSATPRAFRATTWLGAAPFVLAGRTEVRGADAGIDVARKHARAAMLLSRLVDHDVDPEVSEAYARVARLVSFVWGAPDDLSLVELGDLAEALKIDLTKPRVVANVTNVDPLRHRAALLRPPQVFDGSGGLGREGKPPATVRVLGGHASPGTRALASLASGDLAKVRPLPALLDVAAWLGAPGVRTTLHDAGLDAAPGYEDALARAVALRPGEDDADRHASIHGSLVDVLLHWAEAKGGTVRSVATDRARTESLLAAWTLARREGRPFTRAAPKAVRPRELAVSGTSPPVFVEAAPDAIAHLLSGVRQANRGLGALGRLDAQSPFRTALAEIEDLLGLALRVATNAYDGLPPAAADVARLGSLPARIAALEGDLPDADLAALVDVATHPRTKRALVAGVAGIEPVVVLARDPSRAPSDVVLAVGAHLALAERIEELAARTSEAAWVSAVRAGTAARPVEVSSGAGGDGAVQPGDLRAVSWLSTFRMTRPTRALP